MTGTTTSTSALLRPEEVNALLVLPTMAASVAAQVSTVVRTNSTKYRIPMVKTDPQAGWVAEGAEIPVTDADIEEIEVTPTKVAGLSIISSELAADSSPEASQAIGDGLARDIAKRVDQAFFGALAAPAASGLGALTGVTVVDAGAEFADLDAFAAAASAAEQVGASIGHWVANPADALALAQLKTYGSAGSNVPLLTTDPAQPSRRLVNGVPLLVSSAVTAGSLWGLDSSRCFVVVREDAAVDVDPSAYFSSDRVGVRGKMRIGFGFPQAEAVVKITVGAEG